MDKYREVRFSDQNQKIIEAEIKGQCAELNHDQVKDLMGCISSLMILEDYKKEKSK